MDSVHKAFTNIDEIHDMLKGYDAVQGYFKKTATIANLPYHTRNAISAYLMNWYGGMKMGDSMGDYKMAGEVLFKTRAGKELVGKEKELWDEFADLGLNAQLFQGVEDMGDRVVQSLGASTMSKTIGHENPLFRAGTSVGRGTEDFFRFAHYTNKRRQGFSPYQASESVKKVHYDYSDLSDFEQNIMRRIFPFYSWTRKNLPRTLEILFSEPEKIARIEKISNAFEDMFEDAPLDPELLPDFLAEGIPVFIGKDDNGDYQYFRLKGVVPALDLGVLGDPLKEGAGMMSPLIKTPLELGTNYDLFRGQRIRDYEGQTVDRFGGNVKVSPEINKLLQNIRPIQELEKATTERESDLRGTQGVMSSVVGSMSKLDKDKATNQRIYKLRLEVQAMKRDVKKLKKKRKPTTKLNNEVKRKEKEIKTLKKKVK